MLLRGGPSGRRSGNPAPSNSEVIMPKITNVKVKSVKLTADMKLSADEATSMGLLTTADVGDLNLQIAQEAEVQQIDHEGDKADQRIGYESDRNYPN